MTDLQGWYNDPVAPQLKRMAVKTWLTQAPLAQFGTVFLLNQNEKRRGQRESRKKTVGAGTHLPSSFLLMGRFLDDFQWECIFLKP